MTGTDFIYLNNAATSWPKPPEVLAAIQQSLLSPFTGGGRSATRDSKDYIWSARSAIADLLSVRDNERVIFSHNATDALNTLIQGFCSAHKGKIHVITSALEHNSVLRPLSELQQAGRIHLTILPLDGSDIDSDAIEESITPETRLAVLTHGSNVLGSVQKINDIGRHLHEHGIFLITDGSQTAGHIPISVNDMHTDAYVFTGHKALFGIPGTGGFVIKNPEEINPVRFGGTGSYSSVLTHPRGMPERFEAGTHNFPGLAALEAGVGFIQSIGLSAIEEKGIRQTRMMIQRLKGAPNIIIQNEFPDLPIISLNIDGLDNDDLGFILTRKYQIITRSGLHCAPLVHKEMDGGTGSVRLSLSWFTTDAECLQAAEAILEVARCADNQVSQA
ncbi:aminotransferase class V-fold PLP-dependent enzyme [uncultured Methanospirillum sp.]|uniref:aminotransferase class V-fold PLP-dependent enzyme n=1 Tax=uncultured Methanospirillum sp. TaxID=262503 RepID=UPI0029C9A368|nr:aminotransferase class V-fold PLP-dependent enzyme [uncultured Methanospirillum sp.]